MRERRRSKVLRRRPGEIEPSPKFTAANHDAVQHGAWKMGG
jgi:hypothetical protein